MIKLLPSEVKIVICVLSSLCKAALSSVPLLIYIWLFDIYIHFSLRNTNLKRLWREEFRDIRDFHKFGGIPFSENPGHWKKLHGQMMFSLFFYENWLNLSQIFFKCGHVKKMQPLEEGFVHSRAAEKSKKQGCYQRRQK